MKKLTEINFTKHELLIDETDVARIYTLKIPGTQTYRVTFINSNGILAVTGDFGNWIFCREFDFKLQRPLNPGYAAEKLQINSCQNTKVYDSDATVKALHEAIINRVNEVLHDEDNSWVAQALEDESHDFEEDNDKFIRYYANCLNATDDEFFYNAASRDFPYGLDDIIIRYEYPPYFLIIVDAMNEITKRLNK